MGIRSSKDKQKNLSPGMEKVAMRIVKWIVLVQTKWAKGMSRLFERIPVRFQWIVLICCSVLMIMASGQFIWNGITGNGQKVFIKRNAILPLTTGDQAFRTPGVSVKQSVQIMAFRATIDSLARTREGQMKLDSFFRRRPGLRDSIQKIESIYKRRKD